MSEMRGRQTGCAVPDTTSIHDKHAELIVCSCILRDAKPVLAALEKELGGVRRGEFYWNYIGVLYDVCVYVANGPAGYELNRGWNTILVQVNEELHHRKEMLDCERVRDRFATLIDVWDTDLWLGDDKDGKGMMYWGDDFVREYRHYELYALAAATKVKHLAARRTLAHTALEALRDATDSTGDDKYLHRRIKNIGSGDA